MEDDGPLAVTTTLDHVTITATTARIASPVPAPELLPPSARLGRYEIERLLGVGGMGTVYRARDTELARDVALKRIDPNAGPLDEMRARLRREAQAMARVEHPAVVRIYDVGVEGDQLFVAMELVDGGTLADWLAARPRSWREIVSLFVEVGQGIAAAHDRGVVHRDVKPSNILVDRAGHAHVSDFGLACAVGGAGGAAERPSMHTLPMDLTVTGALQGTPAYMAPEQLDAAEVTPAADQFSFAVALWEAVCGVRPFELAANTPAGLARLRDAIGRGEIGVPPAGRMPAALEAILRRTLTNDPGARWPSMHVLLGELERVSERPRQRRWLVAAIAFVAMILGALWWAQHRPSAAPSSDTATASAAPSLPLGERHKIASGQGSWVALLRDGRIVASSPHGIVVSTLTRAAPVSLPPPAGAPMVRAWPTYSPGVLQVFTGDERRCSVWRVATNGAPPSHVLDTDCTGDVDASPDGTLSAVAHDRTITVAELATGAVRWSHASAEQDLVRWSPDGTKLAVAGHIGNTQVLDARTGEPIVQGDGGTGLAWLDADRLVHGRAVVGGRSDLLLLDVATKRDTVVQHENYEIQEITASSSGLVMLTETWTGRVYTVPGSPTTPVDLDQATPTDTGADEDRGTIGWTDDGRLLTTSVIGESKVVMRTLRGDRGRLLYRGAMTDRQLAAGGGVLAVPWTSAASGDCGATWIDPTSGAAHVTTQAVCGSEEIACAARNPTCLVLAPDGLRWVDLTAGAVLGAAPDLASPLAHGSVAIADDGTELALVREDHQVEVRERLEAHGRIVELHPALPAGEEVERVAWGGTASFLLVVTLRGDAWSLLAVARDGTWRPVAHGTNPINTPSAAGDSIAVAVVTSDREFDYYPFLDPR